MNGLDSGAIIADSISAQADTASNLVMFGMIVISRRLVNPPARTVAAGPISHGQPRHAGDRQMSGQNQCSALLHPTRSNGSKFSERARTLPAIGRTFSLLVRR